MTNVIKNIVFDLGNVLCDIDYKLTRSALSEIIGQDFEYFESKNKSIFAKFAVGEISSVIFINSLLKQLSLSISANEIIHGWNKMLIGIRQENFELLKTLNLTHQIYLTASSNEFHFQWLKNHLVLQNQWKNWNEIYFKRQYYSHLCHLRNPSQDFFKYMLKDSAILSKECLFIDDLEKNTKLAKNLGFHVYTFNSYEETLHQILFKLGII